MISLQEIREAYADGKEIQCRHVGSHLWVDRPQKFGGIFPNTHEYRIKPSTLVRWCFTVFYPETGEVVVRVNDTYSEAQTGLNTFWSQGWKVLEDVTRKEWEVQE